MRTCVDVRTSLLTVLVIAMSACASTSQDAAPGEQVVGWVSSPSESSIARSASDQVADGVPGEVTPQADGVPGGATPQALNCSFVQWCDVPANQPFEFEGARCVQRAAAGCNLDIALDECVAETWRVCGTPKCPWAFVELDGSRLYRDPCPGPRP